MSASPTGPLPSIIALRWSKVKPFQKLQRYAAWKQLFALEMAKILSSARNGFNSRAERRWRWRVVHEPSVSRSKWIPASQFPRECTLVVHQPNNSIFVSIYLQPPTRHDSAHGGRMKKNSHTRLTQWPTQNATPGHHVTWFNQRIKDERIAMSFNVMLLSIQPASQLCWVESPAVNAIS